MSPPAARLAARRAHGEDVLPRAKMAGEVVPLFILVMSGTPSRQRSRGSRRCRAAIISPSEGVAPRRQWASTAVRWRRLVAALVGRRRWRQAIAQPLGIGGRQMSRGGALGAFPWRAAALSAGLLTAEGRRSWAVAGCPPPPSPSLQTVPGPRCPFIVQDGWRRDARFSHGVGEGPSFFCRRARWARRWLVAVSTPPEGGALRGEWTASASGRLDAAAAAVDLVAAVWGAVASGAGEGGAQRTACSVVSAPGGSCGNKAGGCCVAGGRGEVGSPGAAQPPLPMPLAGHLVPGPRFRPPLPAGCCPLLTGGGGNTPLSLSHCVGAVWRLRPPPGLGQGYCGSEWR